MMRTRLQALAHLIFVGSCLQLTVFGDETARGDDIIHLKNGSRIAGKVVSEATRRDGDVVLQIGSEGRIFLRGEDISRIEKSVGKAEDTTAGFVAVTLSKGESHYGNGTYYGQESSESDENTLVLRIPDVGIVRIERAGIAGIARVAAADAEEASLQEETREIKTTHRLHLRNGSKVIGNLVDDGDGDRDNLRLRLGQLGVVEYSRREVDRIEEIPGVYKLPPAVEYTELPEAGEIRDGEVEIPADLLERLKEELRDEILDELLNSAIERKIGQLQDWQVGVDSVEEEIARGLTNDDVLEIQHLTLELGRQRTTNRNRAEHKLVDLGSRVLPFLRSAQRHPFDLTRRAVQHIVRDIGDVRGVPTAIEALTDPDLFVRQYAAEALRKLLPDAGIHYRQQAPRPLRLQAQEAYRRYWKEHLLQDARFSLLESRAADNH